MKSNKVFIFFSRDQGEGFENYAIDIREKN